jgi:hypothetical protein
MTEGIEDEDIIDEAEAAESHEATIYLPAKLVGDIEVACDEVLRTKDRGSPEYQLAEITKAHAAEHGWAETLRSKDNVLSIMDQMLARSRVYELPSPMMSFSQVNLYKICGERYRRKYAEKQRFPGSSNMAQGKLVHSVVEELNRFKMFHKVDPPKDMGPDLLSALIPHHTSDIEQWDTKVPSMDVLEKSSRALVDVYVKERLPNTRPRALELHIMDYINGVVPFQGFVDMVEVGEMNEEAYFNLDVDAPLSIAASDEVIDLKCTGKNYGAQRVTNSLQLSLYADALNVERVGFDLLIQTTKATKFVPHRAWRTKAELEHAKDVVEDVAKAISAGIFMKADPESWVCDPKWCEHYGDCRERRKGASVLITNGGTDE